MNITRLMELLNEVPAQDRKAFLETALAVELGYSFPLPANKVDSVVVHFEQFCAPVVKEVIGRLNEMYPFSINVTYNMAVDVYKNRYVLCHEPRLLTVEDICVQLKRSAFEASVDAQHACVLNNSVGGLMRGDLSEFIRRFIAA